jgi:adenine-specific DNA-methyltransferase
VVEIEAQRQVEQERLDGRKCLQQRNRLGQFATPPALALDIARHAAPRQGRSEKVAFLDPAIGSGAFDSAFRQVFPADIIGDACGVEIDPDFARAARSPWGPTALRVIEGDSTRLEPDRRYNLILTNPPYVRHHHLAREDEARLLRIASERLGVPISGLAGLYAQFLLPADAWLADGGLGIWLIPSEFMDVN